MPQPVVLAYWNFRALAEPIRCLLNYVGVDFEDKRYVLGPAPDFDRTEWLNAKYSFGFDFPNLPYYIEGEIKLTQTLAILRHLGRKHGLYPGNTEKEISRADMVEQHIKDLLYAFVAVLYSAEKYESEKAAYLQSLPGKMAEFSRFMGDHLWLLSNDLTYLDFYFVEILEWHRFLDPTCLDSFGNLKDYVRRFQDLPNVAKYRSSDKFKKWPLVSSYAVFGGSGDPPEV